MVPFTLVKPPFPEPETGDRYPPVHDRVRHMRAIERMAALLNGAASVADPWASFFEEEPWTLRSSGFARDKRLLAWDAYRAFMELNLNPQQERLFDPEKFGRTS